MRRCEAKFVPKAYSRSASQCAGARSRSGTLAESWSRRRNRRPRSRPWLMSDCLVLTLPSSWKITDEAFAALLSLNEQFRFEVDDAGRLIIMGSGDMGQQRRRVRDRRAGQGLGGYRWRWESLGRGRICRDCRCRSASPRCGLGISGTSRPDVPDTTGAGPRCARPDRGNPLTDGQATRPAGKDDDVDRSRRPTCLAEWIPIAPPPTSTAPASRPKSSASPSPSVAKTSPPASPSTSPESGRLSSRPRSACALARSRGYTGRTMVTTQKSPPAEPSLADVRLVPFLTLPSELEDHRRSVRGAALAERGVAIRGG